MVKINFTNFDTGIDSNNYLPLSTDVIALNSQSNSSEMNGSASSSSLPYFKAKSRVSLMPEVT